MRGGFTLIELLIVMGMLGIVAAVTVVAINPRRHLCEANNAKREITVREFSNAANQYTISTGDMPKSDELPTGEENAKPVCRRNVTTDPTCVSLDLLVPDYLLDIPVDLDELDNRYSGYAAYKTPDGVHIVTTHAVDCRIQ